MNQSSQKKRRFESPLRASIISLGVLSNLSQSEEPQLLHRLSNSNLTLKRKGRETSPLATSSSSSSSSPSSLSSSKRAATSERVLLSHIQPVHLIKRPLSPTPNSSSSSIHIPPSRGKQRLGHASPVNLDDDCSICIESVNPQDSVLLPCQHYCEYTFSPRNF